MYRFRKLLIWAGLASGFTLNLFGQGTTFTYQGQLQDTGSPANGTYNLQFLLYTNSAGGTAVTGPVVTNGVTVSNGLFTVQIDFGASVWNGATNWLEIAVETNGATPFITLAPRQQATPTPYSITAENLNGTVAAGSLSGTYGNPVTLSNFANQFSGGFTGNGGGLTNLNAASLGGLNASNFWRLGGNNIAAGQFLGSTNNQAVEFWANNQRVLRLEPNVASGAPNIIGGSFTNAVDPGVVGAFIGGGGATNVLFQHYTNRVSANFGSIVGGGDNVIQQAASFSAIGGGIENGIGANSSDSVIAGGLNNSIFTFASDSAIGGGLVNQIYSGGCTISGGERNMIQPAAGDSFIGGGSTSVIGTNSLDCVIGGGLQNVIETNSASSVIAGGQTNIIYSNVTGAFVGGGFNNYVNGTYGTVAGGYNNGAGIEAFAAGFQAYASANSFCWNDGSLGPISSSPNQFLVVASAGMDLLETPLIVNAGSIFNGGSTFNADVGIGVTAGTGGYELQLSADSAAKPNGGSWANSSDARIKKDIKPLTGALDKLVQLRGVTFEWINPEDHADETGIQSGFIAQDVERVFPDWVTEVTAPEHDKSLTSDGKVRSLSLPFAYDALVVEAVKELRAEKDKNIADLKAKNDALEKELVAEQAARVRTEARLADLERTVAQLTRMPHSTLAATPTRE